MRSRNLHLRCMTHGPILAILGHASLNVFGQPLPTSWVKWYGLAVLLFPLACVGCYTPLAFLSRLISLTPRHVVIHTAATSCPIFGRQIRGWAFRALPTDPAQALLRIRYVDKQQRRRAATVALARHVEPAEVDHLLRVIARLAQ